MLFSPEMPSNIKFFVKAYMDLVTLKTNVVIEPLVERWHAWPHLVSPATAALNILNRHLAIMESFVAAPEAHAAACANPALRGGPFLDLPVTSVDAIKRLILETREHQSNQIIFGEALRTAYRLIIKEADGFSIEQFYEKLPDAVKGYVELSYTTAGFPDLRVIEPLLYRSTYNTKSSQSAMIYQIDGDHRAFAFSTPRLPNENTIEIFESFDSGVYDFLSLLRFEPKPISDVIKFLNVPQDKLELLKSFLEPNDKILTQHSPNLDKTRWRYFGHACVLVETPDGSNVLVDPLIAYEASSDLDRFLLKDLPSQIDYVVLTHNHADHVLIETLLALRPKIRCIIVPASGGGLADPCLKAMLQSIGFTNVVALDSLDEIQNGSLKITALPFLGEHGDLNIRSKAAWLINSGDKRFLFAADSNNLEPKLYDIIKQEFGKINSVFIGMECVGAPVSWTYGPLMPNTIDRKKDQSRRLNGSDFERGFKAIKSLECDEVYVYAMGAEPWLQYVTSIDPSEDTPQRINALQLIQACKDVGIKAEYLFAKAEAVI